MFLIAIVIRENVFQLHVIQKVMIDLTALKILQKYVTLTNFNIYQMARMDVKRKSKKTVQK